MTARHPQNACSTIKQEIDLEEVEGRVQRPNSSLPHPFLSWAGSKRYILKYIVDLLPGSFNTYREPFLGSGALFFLLRPKRAVISDTCDELIDTFTAIRDNVDAVINYLRPWKPRKRLFYQIRQHRSRGSFKRAAEFIYLNKSCWNGLYRVNSEGIFNVPYGSPKSDFIADFDNLRECARALRGPEVNLVACDFEKAIAETHRGDLVYLDPPYVTGHSDNGFIEYNEVIFSWADQLRLAKAARRLAANGAHVIVSNADYDRILDLYPGFSIKHFDRSSTLASDVTKRRVVSEVLLFSIR
jgi:DNA adenine methylase